MDTLPTALQDVVIVGAGPVGLFLACELCLAGCSVLILEQAADPRSALKAMPLGLRGLSAATIETLDRRNLLDGITAHAIGRDAPAAAHWTSQKRRAAGHFAGISVFHDHIDETQWPYRRPDAVETLAIAMQSLESALAARAAALGATIRRGCAVRDVIQSDDGVAVRIGAETVHGRWLVGCDGGRSAIRKIAGIGFTGTDPEFTGYSLSAVLAEPNRLPAGRHYTAEGMYTYAAPGTIAMVDFDGGAFHRTDPITLDHLQTVLRRISGTDVTLTAVQVAATWTDRAHQATDYRHGRLILAGDAAHIHSPLGGQGLNLGLGDALNLGWKLAATIRGDAPPGLLDSYGQERHPVGATILDWSRAQVALMRPTRSSRAIAAIIRDLIETRDGATYVAGRMSGIVQRYDLGGRHPLIGRSAPDVEMADGTRLNQQLRSGRGLLLDFDRRPSRRTLAERWHGRIGYVAGETQTRFGLSTLLVRPDGIVAWASDLATDDAGLAEALSRWFGQPPESADSASIGAG